MAFAPRRGVGIDISSEMVRLAQRKHPELEFHHMAAEHLDLGGEKFDYILLSDLPGFLFDIRLVFERLHTVCHPGTRVVLHWYSRAWQPILSAAERLATSSTHSATCVLLSPPNRPKVAKNWSCSLQLGVGTKLRTENESMSLS